jgi:putative transposase
MESFFSSLKTELVHRTQFRTRREAKAALFEYIEIFYNRKRRHSGIDYRTPAHAHAEMLIKGKRHLAPTLCDGDPRARMTGSLR